MEEKLSKKGVALQKFLCIADSILAIVIICPLVVGYWRGCWQLMDIYLLPSDEKHSMYASLALGLSSGVIFGMLQNFFPNTVCKKGTYIWFLVVSRLYTIVYCLGCVNHWRGVWMAWDIFIGVNWQSGVASAGMGLFLLLITRGVNNILASPFVVVTDHREDYFTIQTLFNIKRENHFFLFCDLLFTVGVTGSLVVFVWRGSWVFLDEKLFPNYPAYSAWGSLIIGLTVSIMAYFLQVVLLHCLKDMKKGFCKTMIEDLYNTFCFVGSVNIWRGVWNLLNIYLYPENPALSNAITTVGGNMILILLFCANATIPARGAELDGSKRGAKGIAFPVNYLRTFSMKRKFRSYEYKSDVKVENLLAKPSLQLESSKSNGLVDGRGRGDGSSYSDSYNSGPEDTSNLEIFCVSEAKG